MLEMILVAMIPFILILLVIHWMTGWASRKLTRDIGAMIRAAEELVEQRQLPEEWLAPHRVKLSSLPASGAADQQVAQVAAAAKKDCLRRIDGLIRFFERGSLSGDPATRDSVVAALQSERRRLENEDWHEILIANSAEMERISRNDDK
jgi:hypothetical protein